MADSRIENDADTRWIQQLVGSTGVNQCIGVECVLAALLKNCAALIPLCNASDLGVREAHELKK